MSKRKKPTGVFIRLDSIEQIRMLNNEERGELFLAILEYGNEGNDYTGGNRLVQILFQGFKNIIDENFDNYAKKCDNMSGAALKREEQKRAKLSQESTIVDNSAQLWTSKVKESKVKESKVKESKVKESKVKESDEKENNNVNIEGSEKPKRTRTTFVKPTIEECQDYANTMLYTFDVRQFYDFYESNGWRVGRNPMKDWRAAMRNWNKNEQHFNNRNNNGNGNHNSDHPTNAEVIRNTEELIREFSALDEQGVPFFRDF